MAYLVFYTRPCFSLEWAYILFQFMVGNVFIHSEVFVAWFDYKIANQYVAKMA